MITVTVLYEGQEAFRAEMDAPDSDPRWNAKPGYDDQMAECQEYGAYAGDGPQALADAENWVASANGDVGFYCEDSDKGPWRLQVDGWTPPPASPDFEPEGIVY